MNFSFSFISSTRITLPTLFALWILHIPSLSLILSFWPLNIDIIFVSSFKGKNLFGFSVINANNNNNNNNDNNNNNNNNDNNYNQNTFMITVTNERSLRQKPNFYSLINKAIGNSFIKTTLFFKTQTFDFT